MGEVAWLRVEADPGLPAATLPRDVLAEICAHAVQAHPEECCGLVTGDARQRFRSAHRCENDMNRLHHDDPENHPRDGRSAFHMREEDYQRVAAEAEARGEQVSGIYHSHVEAGAYLSEMDQEFAVQELFPFPDADHIVVSVVDRKVSEVALFRRLRNGGGSFEGRRVEAELSS